MIEDREYTTAEAMRFSGATERQVGYWRGERFVTARITASNDALYPATEVLRMYVLARLGGKGKYVGRRMRKLTEKALNERWLLFNADWKLIVATDSQEEVLRISAAAKHPVRLVEMSA